MIILDNKLDDMKESFLQSKGINSENTLATYNNILNTFMAQNGNDFNKIVSNTYTDLNLYFKRMLKDGRKPSTVNSHITVIKEFYKELELNGYVISNTIQLIKKYKINNVDSYYIPNEEEIDLLLAIASKESRYAQEKVLFLKVAYATAFRYSAIESLKVKNLQVEGNNYYIESVDKGNKKNISRISKEVYVEIMDFIANKNLGKNDDIFEISYKTITRFMKKAQVEMELEEENFTFHSIRKASIDYVVSTTKDIRIAQAHANHSSSSTTIDIYSKKIEKELLPIVLGNSNKENEDILKGIDGETLKELLLTKLNSTELNVLLNKII